MKLFKCSEKVEKCIMSYGKNNSKFTLDLKDYIIKNCGKEEYKGLIIKQEQFKFNDEENKKNTIVENSDYNDDDNCDVKINEQKIDNHKQKDQRKKYGEIDVGFMYQHFYVFNQLKADTKNGIATMCDMIDDGDWNINTLARNGLMDELFLDRCGRDEYELILQIQNQGKKKSKTELLQIKQDVMKKIEDIENAEVLKETGNDYFS